jgi:hypothetical protein
MAVSDGGSARKPGAGLITESDVEPGRPAAGCRIRARQTGLRPGPHDIQNYLFGACPLTWVGMAMIGTVPAYG